MTRALELDLDTPAPPRPAPRWRQQLPWVLWAVTLAVLVGSLALRFPATQPAPQPTPAEVTIDALEQTGGVSPGHTVLRDGDGRIVAVIAAVRPYEYETVGCRLVVDGREVVAEGRGGWPAICVWVRDAA